MLEHLPQFGVVVCIQCRYAIQPTALDSHLLGHRMYRKSRQRLVRELSSLDLLDAGSVPLPDPDAPPQPHLPIHSGYICSWPNCGRPFVSRKRMTQHWSQDHDEHDSKNVRSRPAQLQTFFRGSKIRYFEVNRSSHNLEIPFQSFQFSASPSDSERSSVSRNVGRGHEIIGQDDMYFQHYRNNPDLTPHRDISKSSHFWQVTIFEEAAKHTFLTCAILGLAAAHLASQTKVEAEQQRHWNASLRYQAQGAAEFLSALQNADVHNSVALVLYGRFMGIQRLMLHLLATQDPLKDAQLLLDGQNELQSVVEMFNLFRGQAKVMLDLQHLLPSHNEFTQRLGGDSERAVFNSNLGAPTPELDTTALFPSGRLLVARIQNLPQDLQNANALTSHEIDTLSSACTACLSGVIQNFSSSDLTARWHGLTAFVLALPPAFAEMLKAQHPAALVLFGHWCPLLQRLEQDYVFLRGQSARLLSVLRNNLQPDVAVLLQDLEELGSVG